MPTAAYGEFRVVLARDVATRLFHQMLRQARLTQAEFFRLLREG
jgi:hypothetical protein